jgi:hypothetical protein
MQNPDTLLPADFGLTKRKCVGRIIDDDEVNAWSLLYSILSMLFFLFVLSYRQSFVIFCDTLLRILSEGSLRFEHGTWDYVVGRCVNI